MSLHQPFVHDLEGVFYAPLQAWAQPSGLMQGAGAEGVFLGDHRVISHLHVHASDANGEQGELSPIGFATPSATHTVHTDVISLRGLPVDPVVRLVRHRRAEVGAVTEELTVSSAADAPIRLTLSVLMRTDATPMSAIKDRAIAVKYRAERPVASVHEGTAARFAWSETGAGAVRASGAQVSAEGSEIRVRAELELAPNTSTTFSWRLDLEDAALPFTGVSEPMDMIRLPLPESSRITGDSLAGTGEEAHVAAARRLVAASMSDLASLRLARRGHPDQHFFAAGAPWYLTLFGRDSLISASLVSPVAPSFSAATLRTLAVQQGTQVDLVSAEQPGKILHEVRAEGMGVDMGESFLPPVYYGTIDATPLWMILAADVARAGEDITDLAENVEAAAVWLVDYSDADGDSFLEYIDASGTGLANQGWKDSGDSIRFADGSIAEGPIALAEVQGYGYEAAHRTADLLEEWNRAPELVARLRERAEAIRTAFREQFWVEDERGPYIALALDGHKRPVDGVASNMGHVVGTGLLTAEEERIVVDRLMDPTMASGFGVRTLSTDNGAYWPMRYHGGSVWTHDTGYIIRQFLRAGFEEEAAELAHQLLRAARGFQGRLPELYAGDSADDVFPPLPYPASCRPQAWAAASAVPVAQALGAL